MNRKASKQRTVYTLELSPEEWGVVASLLEMAVDGTGVTFGDWQECNGPGVLHANRARVRMAAADRARARKVQS